MKTVTKETVSKSEEEKGTFIIVSLACIISEQQFEAF